MGPPLLRKRHSEDKETPSKRKPSPIHFEAQIALKKEGVPLYSPPKDKFSKKFANGSKFDDYHGGRRGSRQGGRGNRGRMWLKDSWRD